MFNAEKELAELQQQTQLIRKKVFRRSRLDRYKGQLLTLRHAGASKAELQRWLRKKRVTVSFSTVSRWIDKNG